MRGISLNQLAKEVERQNNEKRDFVAPASRIKLASGRVAENDPSSTLLAMEGHEDLFDIGELCHQQLGEYVKVPRSYYKRMLSEAPTLLRRNVNHWLAQDRRSRMVRTLDGRARAFLSDRYRVLDNYDLCEAVLPLFASAGLEVVSADVTERRLYLKAIHPKLKAKVGPRSRGDVVQGGVNVWNSETGYGTVGAAAFIYRLQCLNGMTVPETGLKKFHLGRRYEGNEDRAREVYRDETREADDKAFFMKVQDVVQACLEEKRFKSLIEKLNEAAEDTEITSKNGRKIEDVIEVTRKSFGLTETESDSILKHLIDGGDLSRWGVANAITRAAHDVESYDRSDELQRIGGQIIELPRNRWRDIALQN